MLAAFLIRQKHLNAATAVAEVSSPLFTIVAIVIIAIVNIVCHCYNHYHCHHH